MRIARAFGVLVTLGFASVSAHADPAAWTRLSMQPTMHSGSIAATYYLQLSHGVAAVETPTSPRISTLRCRAFN